jgi:hypothetical protein
VLVVAEGKRNFSPDISAKSLTFKRGFSRKKIVYITIDYFVLDLNVTGQVEKIVVNLDEVNVSLQARTNETL